MRMNDIIEYGWSYVLLEMFIGFGCVFFYTWFGFYIGKHFGSFKNFGNYLLKKFKENHNIK